MLDQVSPVLAGAHQNPGDAHGPGRENVIDKIVTDHRHPLRRQAQRLDTSPEELG